MTETDLKHLEQIVDSDHEMIELLKKEISNLNSDLQQSKDSYRESAEALALHEKVSAQQTLLKHIFYGVIGLIVCMWTLVFVGWLTNQETIESEMAFFERIILVFIGIVGGAIFPFLIALIGEFMGLKIGMLIIFLGLIYILFVGFVAKPLVSNRTIQMKRK